MSWSQSQLQMLHAMGHQPMVLASTAPAPAGAAPEPVIPSQGQAEVAATGAGEFSRLLKAIHLAAGGRDVSGLVSDPARLRREPALKRALWPALRNLRRSH